MKRIAQRGAALLAAMLTVTLVATFAAASLWQQWRSVEIEAADRTRVKSEWIITGALDWARLILRENRNPTDHLGEPWAVPLQEARLGTFLAADQTNSVDLGDADNVFLSGDITDLQSRLNLGNLLPAAGKPDQPEWEPVFQRLFEVLGLPQSQFARLKENLRFAGDLHVDNLNSARAPLMPQRIDQLVWLGVSAEVAAALQPYVTILPGAGQGIPTVNLNTAPAEVLYAAIAGIGLADAQRLVAERERQHFTSVTKAEELLPEGVKVPPGKLGVRSSFFEVRGRLRIDDVVIEERSIVHQQGLEVRTLSRRRVAPATPPAPQSGPALR